MTYIFSRNTICELMNDGCKKNIINSMNDDWNSYPNNNSNKNYIINKLGITEETLRDKPPLVSYQEEGRQAETSGIRELSYRNRIVTNIKELKNLNRYREFHNDIINKPHLCFDKNNRDRITYEKKQFNNKDFLVDFDKENIDVDEFKRIFDSSKYDYVYQLKFLAPDNFYYPLISNKQKVQDLNMYDIKFQSFKPDLIKLIDKTNNKYKVFDRHLKSVNPDKNKIKLQICDIKMSEFSNKFYMQLGIYMVALNAFIYEHGLNDYYEVVTEAFILPMSNEENDDEREHRIKSQNYELKTWNCDFLYVYNALKNVFENEIINIINIIESSNINEYLSVNITPMCATCDYYGGQGSSNIKSEINRQKGIPLESKVTPNDLNDFYNNHKCHYCRYATHNSDDINKLSCISTGEKKLLKKENINTIGNLRREINNPSKNVIEKNITLKSNKEVLTQNLEARLNNDDYIRIKNSKTMNLPMWCDLTIYLDTMYDSQNRTLSLSMMYEFNGKDKNNSRIIGENNFSDPYIIVTDSKFTRDRERMEFIDFLIYINNVLSKYEKYKDKNGNPAKFAFIYWDEKRREHIRYLFLSVFEYMMKGHPYIYNIYKNIGNLDDGDIRKKYKEIGKLINRFDSFFKSDSKPEDYRNIEYIPFYSLKNALNDLMTFNVDINLTLYSAYTKLTGKDALPIFHKPDSDDFNGGVYSKMWSNVPNFQKQQYVGIVRNVLKNRLNWLRFSLYKVRELYVKDFKAQAPIIPELEKIEGFEKMKFGLDLYLYSKLDTELSRTEKNMIHALNVNKKTVLGKSMLLKEEKIGSQKESILDLKFGKGNYKNSDFKVYEVDSDSIDANFDETSFASIIYPIDKIDYIYKKFTTDITKNNSYYIYYNKDIDFKNYSRSINKNICKSCLGIKINHLDRLNKIIIIELSNDTREVIEFLENNYGFDFSKNVIIESIHVDFWSSRLKKCLQRVEKNQFALDILEKHNPVNINNYTYINIKDAVDNYYKKQTIPLDPSQLDAIVKILNHKLTLLWGPPGTGKSHTIAHLLLAYYWLNKINQGPIRILIMGNYDATDNILKSFMKLIHEKDVAIRRLKSKDRPNANLSCNNIDYGEFIVTSKLSEDKKNNIMKMKNRFQIFTCTNVQVSEIFISRSRWKFDFVIIDEASQMRLDQFIPSLIRVGENTQFLIAGDHLQLAPITGVKLKDPEKNIYGSVMTYYLKEFNNITIAPLTQNRRSNKVIVDFGRLTFGYNNYVSDKSVELSRISFKETLDNTNLYDRILNPDDPFIVLNYDDIDYSAQKNEFEANQIVNIVKNIYNKKLYIYNKPNIEYNLINLFEEGIGIVVPHRAQRSKVRKGLLDYFTNTLEYKNLSVQDQQIVQKQIESCVDTVEKYQGQQREIMICSYVLGNEEYINMEEEFIYNPNRLNVMISRARFKVIVLASNQLINNISNDYEITKLQQILKQLTTYCQKSEEINEHDWKIRNGILRYKSF